MSRQALTPMYLQSIDKPNSTNFTELFKVLSLLGAGEFTAVFQGSGTARVILEPIPYSATSEIILRRPRDKKAPIEMSLAECCKAAGGQCIKDALTEFEGQVRSYRHLLIRQAGQQEKTRTWEELEKEKKLQDA